MTQMCLDMFQEPNRAPLRLDVDEDDDEKSKVDIGDMNLPQWRRFVAAQNAHEGKREEGIVAIAGLTQWTVLFVNYFSDLIPGAGGEREAEPAALAAAKAASAAKKTGKAVLVESATGAAGGAGEDPYLKMMTATILQKNENEKKSLEQQAEKMKRRKEDVDEQKAERKRTLANEQQMEERKMAMGAMLNPKRVSAELLAFLTSIGVVIDIADHTEMSTNIAIVMGLDKRTKAEIVAMLPSGLASMFSKVFQP